MRRKTPTKHNFSLGVKPGALNYLLTKPKEHVFIGSGDVGRLLRGHLVDAEYDAVMEYIVSLEKALQARDDADAGSSL